LVKDSMCKWEKRRGPFTADAYADVNGKNSMAGVWFSQQSRPGAGALTGQRV